MPKHLNSNPRSHSIEYKYSIPKPNRQSSRHSKLQRPCFWTVLLGSQCKRELAFVNLRHLLDSSSATSKLSKSKKAEALPPPAIIDLQGTHSCNWRASHYFGFVFFVAGFKCLPHSTLTQAIGLIIEFNFTNLACYDSIQTQLWILNPDLKLSSLLFRTPMWSGLQH